MQKKAPLSGASLVFTRGNSYQQLTTSYLPLTTSYLPLTMSVL